MYYVYIIQSQKDQSYYTGYTINLVQRIKHHNSHSSKYSSTKAPFELICAFKNERKAILFEKYLKIGSGFAFARKHLT